MALRSLVSRKTLTLGSRLNQAVRGLQTFTLPDLPYDYVALEPVISAEIMQIHHQKHHQTYVTNYNKALEQLDQAMAKGDASAVVKLQSAIKFNGGGHVNHSIFWKKISIAGGSSNENFFVESLDSIIEKSAKKKEKIFPSYCLCVKFTHARGKYTKKAIHAYFSCDFTTCNFRRQLLREIWGFIEPKY
ncbi:superoxide dismutase [Ranunculus cassubicifolius]